MKTRNKILLISLLILLMILLGIKIFSRAAFWDDQLSDVQKTGNTDQNGLLPQTTSPSMLYMVTYDAGSNGSLTSENLDHTTKSVTDGQTSALVPSVNPAAGYTFIGWYKDSQTTLLSSTEAADFAIAADTTFTAQYEPIPYQVTFDLADHGASLDTLAFDPVYYGDTIKVPAVTADRGWTFDGWDVTPLTTVTGSVNYTAQYTHIPYKVTFYLAGHGTTKDRRVFSNVYYGSTITIPYVIADSGWKFTGWNVTPSTKVRGNANYTAQYMQLPSTTNPATYTVTFDLADHGTSSDILIFNSLHKGDTITVPSVIADTDWSFDGWDATPETTVTGSASYTAQYTNIPYTVTFDLADHGTSSDILIFDSLHKGDTITVPSVIADTGWSFDGWDATPETTVTGSASYTAQYTNIPYTVTFDLDGYGTSSDTLEFDPVYYGDEITIPSVTANPGWRFIGWDITPSTTVTGDAVYTARYEIYRPK